MNRIRQRRRAPRRRSGLTLIELMVVAVLLSVIGAMLTALLVRQQRFHRAVTSVTDARARMRDIATILPTDVRSISTVDGDLITRGTTEMQFRAFIGSSIVCEYGATTATIELPPQTLSSGHVLSSWINPPEAGDIVFLYNDSLLAGNVDDDWSQYNIVTAEAGTDASWCSVASGFTQATDAMRTRYRLTIDGTPPNAARVKVGAPIRIAREVRYSVYQATDGQWYVGYQRCTSSGVVGVAGPCGTREVLAGPILAATADTTTSGVYFNYYKQTGALATAATDTVAYISVGIRTSSESIRQAAATDIARFSGGDSLKFVIGLRNRI